MSCPNTANGEHSWIKRDFEGKLLVWWHCPECKKKRQIRDRSKVRRGKR